MHLSFTDLPPEVRNQIYQYVFEGAVIEDHGYSPRPLRLHNYHSAITMTNRQVRTESLPMLYSATTLHFRIGQAGAPPISPKVLQGITKVRTPAHRLQNLDLDLFSHLETLILDVSIEPKLWKLFLRAQAKSPHASTDISDIVHISMTLGVFDHSWDVAKVWRNQARTFRILCWISSWVREVMTAKPVLIDLDSGTILDTKDEIYYSNNV